MQDVLSEIEEKSIGWDREKARSVLAKSLETINIASDVARAAVENAQNMPDDFINSCEELKQHIKDLQVSNRTGGPKALKQVTRADANKIIRTLDQILAAQDVSRIVSMSLDLTKQSQMFVAMMEVISKRFGEEERAKAEDITAQLTPEQLVIVWGMIRENKIDTR